MFANRKDLFFLLIIPIFISCASKNYIINPEYRDKKISNANLIIPTIKDVNFSQFSNIFSEDEVKRIKHDFSLLLSENLRNELKSRSTFSDIKYASFKSKPEFGSKVFDLNEKEKISFSLPKNRIESDIAENVFLLFLEDVTLSLINEEKDTSDPAKHYSVTSTPGNDPLLNPAKFYNQSLHLDLKYCLYDNNNGKTVLFGRFSEKQKFTEISVAENIIKKGIEKFAKKVFENTPFEKD
ncbi:MAG: hypothetical protein NTX65_15715 [Ignavibacteriales bacterium]|nr:hypothetical protein [Ignavibacteriales bacterium]